LRHVWVFAIERGDRFERFSVLDVCEWLFHAF
jgi:hypothetical protein